MARARSYMTEAQYEVYGAIEKLEFEVSRLRSDVEEDWRGRHIAVNTGSLAGLVDDIEDFMSAWHEEDENAPTVDEALKKAATP